MGSRLHCEMVQLARCRDASRGVGITNHPCPRFSQKTLLAKMNQIENNARYVQRVKQLMQEHPEWSYRKCWDYIQANEPQLIPGDDSRQDTPALKDMEPEPTHGAFIPSAPGRYQFSRTVQCKGFENPDGSLTIQGGIISPLC
jgi:hypothetical protein